MSVTVTKEDSSDDDIPLSLLTKGNGDVYMLQEGRTCTVVDGRHRLGAILKALEVTEGETEWAKGHLTLSLVSRKDGQLLKNWEIIMHSKSKNDASSLVRRMTSVRYLLIMANSYAKVFKSTYGFELVDARLADIVRDMENTAFLMGLGRSTYRRYVRPAQHLFNKPAVMQFLLEDSTIAGDAGGKNRSHIG